MKSELERDILHDIRAELGKDPRCVLWRLSQGQARAGNRTFRAGMINGASDLIGLTCNGRFFALEVKTATGRLSTEQALFLRVVNRNGGYGEVVRSVHDALVALARAVAGEPSTFV